MGGVMADCWLYRWQHHGLKPVVNLTTVCVVIDPSMLSIQNQLPSPFPISYKHLSAIAVYFSTLYIRSNSVYYI